MKVTERWYSHRMHRDVTLARWGHYGVPVLLFPTAGGDAEEVERNQLIAHLAPLIDDGRVKVYSCDSVAGQALVRNEGSPEHRMWLFNQFHDTVAHEIVPGHHGRLRRAAADRRGRLVDRGLQLPRDDLPLPPPVQRGGVHERHLPA